MPPKLFMSLVAITRVQAKKDFAKEQFPNALQALALMENCSTNRSMKRVIDRDLLRLKKTQTVKEYAMTCSRRTENYLRDVFGYDLAWIQTNNRCFEIVTAIFSERREASTISKRCFQIWSPCWSRDDRDDLQEWSARKLNHGIPLPLVHFLIKLKHTNQLPPKIFQGRCPKIIWGNFTCGKICCSERGSTQPFDCYVAFLRRDADSRRHSPH